MHCLILEDQQIMLDCLGALVDCFTEVKKVFKANSIKTGKKISIQNKIDVAILDLHLTDGYALNFAIELINLNPKAKLIILSGAAQEFVCPNNLIGSVQGIIDKNDGFESLRYCLNEIINPIHKTLTERQQIIFRMLGEGKTTKEIAITLGSATSTIETHRKAIAKRLEISGSELISKAVLAQKIQSIN